MARRGASLVAVGSLLVLLMMPASAAGVTRKVGTVTRYVVTNILLAAVDYESALAVQHRGGCLESNPAFGHFPSRGRFYGEGLAIDAGPELVGWLLHRKHLRGWQAPFAVVAAWHGEGIVSNLRCNSMAK